MAIPVPNDPLMVTLLFLDRGYRLEPGDAGLVVAGDRTYAPPYLLDALDECEARGWVAVGEAGAAVTEAGRYWLLRWLKAQGGRARKAVERGSLDAVDFAVCEGGGA